uniref:ATP synthase F0 subunit 8 n=1 Tax=Brugia timori TaxID=42155 RepID=A0A0R3QHX9_9BILA
MQLPEILLQTKIFWIVSSIFSVGLLPISYSVSKQSYLYIKS